MFFVKDQLTTHKLQVLYVWDSCFIVHNDGLLAPIWALISTTAVAPRTLTSPPGLQHNHGCSAITARSVWKSIGLFIYIIMKVKPVTTIDLYRKWTMHSELICGRESGSLMWFSDELVGNRPQYYLLLFAVHLLPFVVCGVLQQLFSWEHYKAACLVSWNSTTDKVLLKNTDLHVSITNVSWQHWGLAHHTRTDDNSCSSDLASLVLHYAHSLLQISRGHRWWLY